MVKYFKDNKMDKREDLRVQRTKNALNEAFTKLGNEKSFEDISINDLCIKAEIRRATFYKHFNDKNHFLGEYIGFLRKEYDEKTKYNSKPDITPEYYAEYAKYVVRFVYENEKIINNALRSNMLHVILGIISERNYYDTAERLRKSVNAGMKLPASIESVAAMLTGGVATIICIWLYSDKNRDIETLEKEIETLVFNVLKV